MSSVIPETESIKAAVILINSTDSSRFSRLLTRVLNKLHLKEERVLSSEEEERLLNTLSLDKHDLHLLLDALAFILEQALYHSLSAASLRQHLQSIGLEDTRAEVFTRIWTGAAPDLLDKTKHDIFSPSKLEGVGWQLNLQKSPTGQCRAGAALELRLRGEQEQQQVCVEFNHQELLDFYDKLEMIQKQLDSLS